ncbi:hypothetical protein ES705_17769 [subsurface metagenome]
MERKIPVNKTNSYTTIQDYFLAHWVSTIGLGPTVLYLQLLSYCHKGKDIAWPSIKTLLEYGLIKKIVKQRSSSGGYDHNLYQIVLLDKENILYPPKEKLPEENEKIISGISEESPSCNQDNPKKIVTDNKKSLKTERIKEELEKLNMDKKSIDKTILNYSLEDIEEKLDLLRIKKNVVNPVGWLIAALKANYLNTESFRENDGMEEEEQENKIAKSEKISLEQKEREEKGRLFIEENLKWIEQSLDQRFEM